MKSVERKIKDAIDEHFSADFLKITNESHKHQGHAGDNGTGESHFHLTIIDESFKGQNAVARQRLVYTSLSNLLKTQIHALSLSLFTPEEYSSKE